MDRTSDFGSDSEGSNPSAVTMLNNQPAVLQWVDFFLKPLFCIWSRFWSR